MAKLHIRQTKSELGAPKKQRRTLTALGLKYQRSVVHEDNPAIRGMLFKVRHLIQVSDAPGEEL